MPKKKVRYNFTLDPDVNARFREACGMIAASKLIEGLMKGWLEAGAPDLTKFSEYLSRQSSSSQPASQPAAAAGAAQAERALNDFLGKVQAVIDEAVKVPSDQQQEFVAIQLPLLAHRLKTIVSKYRPSTPPPPVEEPAEEYQTVEPAASENETSQANRATGGKNVLRRRARPR